MPPLPARFAGIILAFAPLFGQRSWRHAQVLLVGAILAPGRRTVASLLRITGRSRERRFVNDHRILSRATWCPRAGARFLLGLLVTAFAPHGPVVLALDDTIERRRGKRIAAKGIYRDPVRSSDSHFVKASGLRWMSLMLLAPIPWAERVWALPFLTALVPSEWACRERGRRHKPLLDVGRQLALQARRWLPGRDLVLLGDSGFSALLFLDAMHHGGVTAISRLRLDAALYEPAPPRPPGTVGRPRTKGHAPAHARPGPRRPGHGLAAPRCAGLVRRGRARHRHRLGHRRVAARRHARGADPLSCWSAIPSTASSRRRCCAPTSRDPRSRSCHGSCGAGASRSPFRRPAPISASRRSGNGLTGLFARTTPCLLALFSIVTLLATRLSARERRHVTTTAWYAKTRPTFADALAAVRRALWREQGLVTSARRGHKTKRRFALPAPSADTLCQAA